LGTAVEYVVGYIDAVLRIFADKIIFWQEPPQEYSGDYYQQPERGFEKS